MMDLNLASWRGDSVFNLNDAARVWYVESFGGALMVQGVMVSLGVDGDGTRQCCQPSCRIRSCCEEILHPVGFWRFDPPKAEEYVKEFQQGGHVVLVRYHNLLLLLLGGPISPESRQIILM